MKVLEAREAASKRIAQTSNSFIELLPTRNVLSQDAIARTRPQQCSTVNGVNDESSAARKLLKSVLAVW
jgi:hypothetical protein